MNSKKSAITLTKTVYRFIDRNTLGLRQPFVATFASQAKMRHILNQYYRLLTSGAKHRFQKRYGGVFKDRFLVSGTWTVRFAGRDLLMPLRSEHAWLDWALAVAILGHDDEIKDTYAALVGSAQCPAVFIDIGANYGTHSVLLLAAGVPTFSFEPNPLCFDQFQTMCDLNGLQGRWEEVALGDHDADIELTYLEQETWLGTVSAAAEALKQLPSAKSRMVPLRRLDDYLDLFPPGPMLIKIDAEGFEHDVIKGAEKTLMNRSPKIIFENDKPGTRPALYRLLQKSGYAVFSLPWQPKRRRPHLGPNEFMSTTASNFIAMKQDA